MGLKDYGTLPGGSELKGDSTKVYVCYFTCCYPSYIANVNRQLPTVLAVRLSHTHCVRENRP